MTKPALFEKKAVSPMFFLGLLFLYFPFYYASSSSHPHLVIGGSIAFGLAYCASLYSSHALFLMGCWFYMLGFIGIMSFWGNIQFSLFLFNLSNLLSWHFSEDRWTYRTVSYALCLVAIFAWALFGPHVFELKAFSIIIHLFGLGLFVGGRIQSKREAMEQKMQEQNRSINLLLAENERNRIGRDLHDTLGHVFAMLSVKAELTKTLLDHQQIDQARKEVEELQEVAKNAMQEVRQIVQSLKQATVAEEVQIIQQMLQLAGVSCQLEGLEAVACLSPASQAHLSMILRELANNLLKHSQAKHCRLGIVS